MVTRPPLKCVERMIIDGELTSFPIGVFFDARGGLLRSAKVFREGSADVDLH